MYNQTEFGVRRSHSFDSSDNLERWQAIREHRRQFLSARAKFDKKPPSEPPPPPPRQESKYRTSLSSSFHSEPLVKEDVQVILEKLRKKDYLSSERNTNSAFSRQTYQSVPGTSFHSHLTDRTNNPVAQDTKEGFEKTNNLEIASNQKNHIELTQRWHRYKAQSFESAKDPEALSSSGKILKEQEYLVSEPPAVKKTVDDLGYEIPTHFQDVTTQSSKPKHPTNSLGNDWTDSSMTQMIDISAEVRATGSNVTDSYYLKRPSDYFKGNPVRETRGSRIPVTSSEVARPICPNYHPDDNKQNKKDYHKTYLESNLKMFTDSLLDQTHSSHIGDRESGCVSNKNDLVRSVKPRRTSTGSMHDPMIWRSHYSGIPVMTLVQKFSKERN